MRFDVMKPVCYYDYKKDLEGKSITITQDRFGIDCIAYVENGKPYLIEPSGDKIKWCNFDSDLLRIYKEIGQADFAFIAMVDWSAKDLFVYDVLDYDSFVDHVCRLPYYQRRQKLNSYLSSGYEHIKPAPVIYSGSDLSKIEFYSSKFDILINDNDAVYEFGESHSCMFA